MVKNLKLRIKVEFVETEADPSADRHPEEQADGSFSLVLPQADELNISALDRAALDVSFPALREALSRHLAEAGKKKLQREAAPLRAEVQLRERSHVYQVEGEVGRFRFALYEACDASGEVVRRGDDWFPKRQPREWHKTEGFREEALCLEASRRSYRDNTAHLNRYRRQWQGGTAVTTLQDNAQKEGARVLDFLERHSQRVLTAHGFEGLGQPSEAVASGARAGTDRRLKAEEVERQLAVVAEEMGKRGFTPEQIELARQRAAGGVYEDPSHCTNVSVDDVQVKKQKAHRERSARLKAEPADGAATLAPAPSDGANEAGKPSRPQVANTVARIEQGTKRFTLSGTNLGQVLRFVLTFLLQNDLLGGRLHLFSDGYRSLQDTLLAFFAWHPRVWLVLDWYHVVKKFKEDLSRACRAREVRNRHLAILVRLLWYGMVSEARRYLETIPAAEVKDPASIERLRNYLERNERSIPCYALRRRLGLRNGSSPVESANNQVTARRQKRNGMSWSKAGSHALTALSVLVCNRCQDIWVREHTVPLRFVDKEAA
jgi:hypothetical protein